MAKHAAHGILQETPRKNKRQKKSGAAEVSAKGCATRRRAGYNTYRDSAYIGESGKSRTRGKNKTNGRKVIVLTAVVCVALAAVLGIFIYLKGASQAENDTPVRSVSSGETAPLDAESSLAVIMVYNNKITYNGEEVTSARELDGILSNEDNPTLSLINSDADAETYNAVVKVLNSHGGSYELMDEKNTNPSISTTESTDSNPDNLQKNSGNSDNLQE